MIKKLLLYGLLLIQLGKTATAQQASIDTVRLAMQQVNSVFDSAQNLAFDIDIYLNSDTVYGMTENDHQFAQYVLNGKNVFYTVGGIDFLQNDSFAISAYNADKTMFVSKKGLKNNSDMFLLRSFSDSLLDYYYGKYNVTLLDSGESRTIKFVTDSADIPYKDITVVYQKHNYFPEKMSFSFMDMPEMENGEDSTASVIELQPVKKTMTLFFLNYHFADNRHVFDEQNFFYFNPLRKEFEAVGKYAGYKVIASNMGITNVEHGDVEVPVKEDEAN
ncbi:MAG: hypothetical protein IPL97_11815 [Niastella sp.]|nr:hypothetical protein [Niastella sp.]